MKTVKIGFVILHYLVYKQTLKAVDAIRKNIDTDEYIIVIIDNYSNNGSIEEVEKSVSSSSDVVILKNNENLGFAKGNNVGIFYLNKMYKPEFICVLNNDVYLKSKNLYKFLKNEFEISEFAVAGPKIYTKDGKSDVNPVREKPFSYKKMLRYKIEICINYFLIKFHLSFIYYLEKRTIQSLLKIRNKNKQILKKQNQDVKKYKVQLHGCFYIFSKNYFRFYDGFDSRTFLYLEEEILYCRTLNKNLVTVYLPNIEVFHEEDASTNALMNWNNRKKMLFNLGNHKKSIKILLQVMKEGKSK